jgi:hypothetical protein
MAHHFSYPLVTEYRLMRDMQAHVTGHGPDREMRCPCCSLRMFSSRAPDLVEAGFLCPRCQTTVLLVPTLPE